MDANGTEAQNLLIPTETYHGVEQPSKCSAYRHIGSNFTVPCSHGYVYDDSVGKTLVDEFDFMCDRAFYKSVILGVHLALMQVMVIFCGYISD